MTAAVYIRFVAPSRIDADSQVAAGLITVAYELVDTPETPVSVAHELATALRWFEDRLAVPERFTRTTSKGWYRRRARGLSWLRAVATEHVAAMHRLAELVRACGVEVVQIETDRVGYIVHEDEVQVIAEPFRDTPTR